MSARFLPDAKLKASAKARYLQVGLTDPEKAAFDTAADLAGFDVPA